MVKEARARSSRSMPSADSRFLAPLWDLCLEHIGVDTLGHPLFFVIAVITTVLVAGAVFSFVDVFISGKLPFKQTALYLAITLPGYLLVFVLLRYLPIEFRFDVPLLAPSLLELARDLVICMVVGDVLSYWWHRLEHGSPFVFRHVHYVHHNVSSPLTVWSGFYVHPVESFCVFVTFYIYPFVMQVHPLVFVTYAALNTFITMVTHCGYDMRFYPKQLFASAPMHEHHHGRRNPTNFCVLLNLSDRLFGTYTPFQEPVNPQSQS